MKKLILLILTVAFLVNYIHAQENNSGQAIKTDYRESFQFGLKGGLNYSNVYDTKGEEFSADPKFGIVGGAFITIPIGKFLGVQPEFLYSQKGFKATGIILAQSYDFVRTTTYIDLPVLLQLKPSGSFTLLAGPQYSFLIKQKDVFANAASTIEQEQEFENENIRKNTLCFLGGFDINMNQFVLGGRVGWDLFKNNGDGTSTTPRYKNTWYQVTLGFRFIQ
jgi:hypothetical protein